LIRAEILFLYIFTPWTLPPWALSNLAPFRCAPAITITHTCRHYSYPLFFVTTFETPTNQNKT